MNKRGIAIPLVLAIVFGVSTLGLGTYVVYDNISDSNNTNVITDKNNESKESVESNEITESESVSENQSKDANDNVIKTNTSIPTSDLFSYWVSGSESAFFKVENNSLYASATRGEEDKPGHFEYGNKSVKFEKILDNVKRIKTFHTRTDVLPTFYIILNDGTVKLLTPPLDTSSTFNVTTFNMQGNKVDDILNVEGEYYDNNTVTFEIKLLDGTVKKINP